MKTFAHWDETLQALEISRGKIIKDIAFTADDTEDGALRFNFTDGSALLIFDAGRSCCEARWMHTDDKFSDFHGAEFRGAELWDGPIEELSRYDNVRESKFLVIRTSFGAFTVVNYNEHNGYYGGFVMRARTEAAT